MTAIVEVDPRVVRGLEAQLRCRRVQLDEGATAIGWKLGLTASATRSSLDLLHPVVGHLTSITRVDAGCRIALDGEGIHVEPELAAVLGRPAAAHGDDLTVVGVAPALEIVRFLEPVEDVQALVATNVCHVAVTTGVPVTATVADRGVLTVDDDITTTVDTELTIRSMNEFIAMTAEILHAVGERLAPGDLILLGSMCPPVPVRRGGRCALHLRSVGEVGIEVTLRRGNSVHAA